MEKSPMIVENVKGNYGFIRGGGPFSFTSATTQA